MGTRLPQPIGSAVQCSGVQWGAVQWGGASRQLSCLSWPFALRDQYPPRALLREEEREEGQDNDWRLRRRASSWGVGGSSCVVICDLVICLVCDLRFEKPVQDERS